MRIWPHVLVCPATSRPGNSRVLKMLSSGKGYRKILKITGTISKLLKFVEKYRNYGKLWNGETGERGNAGERGERGNGGNAGVYINICVFNYLFIKFAHI